MPVMDQATADALRERDLISPEAHAAITAQNAPVSSDAGAPPAIAPTPMLPTPDAATSPPMASVPELAGPAGPGGAMTPMPPVQAPPVDAGPPGHVDVGPITAKPPPPAAPAPQYDVAASPRGITISDRATGADVTPQPVPDAMRDPRVVGTEKANAALTEKEKAAADAGAVREERAQALADQADANNKALAAKDAENEAIAAKDDADARAHVDGTMRKIDEMATKKVDPNRYWANKSTGSKIVAAIGLALGGFAEGLSHGAVKNPALAQLNKAIDADVAAQEGEIAQGNKVVEARRGVMHDMMQLTGSRQAAQLAARSAAIGRAKEEAMAMAMKYDPKLERASTRETLAGIDGMKAANDERLGVTLTTEKRAQQAAAAAARAHADETTWKRAVEKKKLEQDDKRIEVDATKAAIEAAKNGPESRKAEEEDAALRADVHAVSEAWDNALKSGDSTAFQEKLGNFFNTEDSRERKAARSQIVGALKGPGENSDMDAERLGSMAPGPGDNAASAAKKYAMVMNKIAQKHPQAFERAMRNRSVPGISAPLTVPTTKAPGGR